MIEIVADYDKSLVWLNIKNNDEVMSFDVDNLHKFILQLIEAKTKILVKKEAEGIEIVGEFE